MSRKWAIRVFFTLFLLATRARSSINPINRWASTLYYYFRFFVATTIPAGNYNQDISLFVGNTPITTSLPIHFLSRSPYTPNFRPLFIIDPSLTPFPYPSNRPWVMWFLHILYKKISVFQAYVRRTEKYFHLHLRRKSIFVVVNGVNKQYLIKLHLSCHFSPWSCILYIRTYASNPTHLKRRKQEVENNLMGSCKSTSRKLEDSGWY